MTEILRTTLEALLGGGLLLSLLTLKSYRKKSAADSKSAELSADQTALQQFQEYVVNPLKREVSTLRTEVKKLRRAVDSIRDCEYKDRCPVNELLRKEAENENAD